MNCSVGRSLNTILVHVQSKYVSFYRLHDFDVTSSTQATTVSCRVGRRDWKRRSKVGLGLENARTKAGICDHMTSCFVRLFALCTGFMSSPSLLPDIFFSSPTLMERFATAKILTLEIGARLASLSDDQRATRERDCQRDVLFFETIRSFDRLSRGTPLQLS